MISTISNGAARKPRASEAVPLRMIGPVRALASNGISIGVPRSIALEHSKQFPHLEIEVRRESLPTEEAFRFIIEHNPQQLIWHVTIDEFHEAKSFASDDWRLFIAMLEGSNPAKHTLILSYDRTAEYSAKILDAIEEFRDGIIIPVLLDTEHPSWKAPRIQQVLKSLKLPHVFCDAPNLPGIVKDVTYHTSKIAVLRCLGRNSRTWFELSAEERFQYNYNEAELRSIAERVKALRDAYDRVCVTFCNRPGADAIHNAIQLSNLLP